MEPRLTRNAKLTADKAWSQWAGRQIQRRLATIAKLESTGFYLGYQADLERHEIELLSGKVVLAQSLTTSGQSGGEQVAVSRGEEWRFKTVPR